MLPRSGAPMSSRGTLTTGIVPVDSLGENLRFAIRATLGFLRPLHDTGDPELPGRETRFIRLASESRN
jgi:hypothetical protein